MLLHARASASAMTVACGMLCGQEHSGCGAFRALCEFKPQANLEVAERRCLMVV